MKSVLRDKNRVPRGKQGDVICPQSPGFSFLIIAPKRTQPFLHPRKQPRPRIRLINPVLSDGGSMFLEGYWETRLSRVQDIGKHFIPGHMKLHVCANSPNGTLTMSTQTKSNGPKQVVSPRPRRKEIQDLQRSNRWTDRWHCRWTLPPEDPSWLSGSFVAPVMCSRNLTEGLHQLSSTWEGRTCARHFGRAHQIHDEVTSMNGGCFSGFHH